ncbi:unnamed protein product [Clonostachys rhizophaga]|uniref:Major facilitator superfamily (MFS) profile domain-containing protein n=1 Tax=Clonostachys rhizophaga TaxID=160324 RepID=A0A9N9VBQ8_9HYPO|nr:unnamed protein product [Clonostachys rhizophaga]
MESEWLQADASASALPDPGLQGAMEAVSMMAQKTLEKYGGEIGFAVMLTVFTIGVVMMAACQNVVTYSAASVFFWTGFDGMFYVLYVILADNFSLRNRGFMFGLYNAPYLVTTFVGSPIASRFLSGPGWRWSFGTFAIAAPIAGLSLIVLLLWNYRKARLRGGVSEHKEHESVWEGLKYYWVEFDFIGLLLLAGGFSLLLLPFSLYSGQASGWASPMIICMIIFGVLCFVLFAIWEKYWAPKSFLPWELIKDRTIFGGSIASANTYLVYYVWYSYFSSSLQVIQGLDITLAGYVVNIHSVGWVLVGIAAGALIRTTSHYKWIALYIGSPLQILATGLMYHFSGTGSPTGLIVMAQVFLSLADGLIYLTSEVAVLAVIDHEHIAVVLAVYNMVTSIFQAVGATISAAIWTKVFPSYLTKNLPDSAQPQLENIYSSIYSQLSFDKGGAERLAIEQSYSQAMRNLFSAALCLTVIGLVATLFWRDINVKDKEKKQPAN